MANPFGFRRICFCYQPLKRSRYLSGLDIRVLQLARDGSGAKLLKYAVVKTPLSVYEATAGREMYRPVQTTPIPNFFLAGCFTKQKYLASMEGATFSGKLAARALADAAIAGTVS